MFSLNEIRDLFISVVAIAVILAYPNMQNFIIFLAVTLVTFVLHELAHKFVAQKFGAVAFYKMWPQGILIGILTMLLSPVLMLKFISPGAVEIQQYRFSKWRKKRYGFGQGIAGGLTMDEMGLISVSGPLVNFAIAAISALIGGYFFGLLASLNSILAFFNMLPVKPLDGSKILLWKPSVWVFLQICAIALLIGVNLRF